MQIRTTRRHHFTPVRIAIIKKSTNNKCERGCGEKGTLVHCWWGRKLIGAAVMDNSMEVPQESKNRTTVNVKVLVTQSRPTLCNPMDYSLPGSSVHGLLSAGILPIPFSRGSFWPRDWTRVSRTAGRFSTIWATREAPEPPHGPAIWLLGTRPETSLVQKDTRSPRMASAFTTAKNVEAT